VLINSAPVVLPCEDLFQPQEQLYSMPPQHRHPLTQDPRMPGPRRLPPRPHLSIRRPGSLSITASCGQTGCFTVTGRADGRLQRLPPSRPVGQPAKNGTPRDSSQASFPPSKALRGTGTKSGAAGSRGVFQTGNSQRLARRSCDIRPTVVC